MPVVTIPFDYQDLDNRDAVVPICINDTDRHGKAIAWGWFAAVVPVADRLRNLARRRLDDVWRVSELAESSVHDLWYAHGEDFGVFPHLRVYHHARWKAEDLRYGHWRVRKGREVPLGELESLLRDPREYGADYENKQVVDRLRQELLNSGRPDVADMMDMVLHGCGWDEVARHFGIETSSRNTNTLQRRFWRVIQRAAGLL